MLALIRGMMVMLYVCMYVCMYVCRPRVDETTEAEREKRLIRHQRQEEEKRRERREVAAAAAAARGEDERKRSTDDDDGGGEEEDKFYDAFQGEVEDDKDDGQREWYRLKGVLMHRGSSPQVCMYVCM